MKKLNHKRLYSAVLILVLSICLTPLCHAEDNSSSTGTAGTAALVELLKEKGVLSDQEAAGLMERTRKKEMEKKTSPPEPAKEADLEKMAREVADQIRDQVKDKVKEDIKYEMTEHDEAWLDRIHTNIPEWTRRIRFSGDIRLRYQGDFYDDYNYDEFYDPTTVTSGNYLLLLNSTKPNNRFRYRARLGITAEINNQVEAGFRLATGSGDNPISTNETAGDYFNKDYFLLDLAYLKILPIPSMPETQLLGGRFANPFFCSDLVWDGDVNFEGLAVKLDYYATDTLRPIITAGWFPVQKTDVWYPDKYLVGTQVALEYKPRRDLIFTVGTAYYDYHHIKGEMNDPERPGETDWSAPLYHQLGNSLWNIAATDDDGVIPALLGDYKLFNITATTDIAVFHPVHIQFLADYVENVGFDADAVARRLGVEDWPEETTAYQFGLEVGHPSVRKFSEWKVGFFYRYVEADAVLDAFTDSDFHWGGTNCKGWILKPEIGITNNIWLSVKYSTSDEIIFAPVSINVVQVDLNGKF